MGHVVTLAQQKGGSGKTTLAANLAVAAAEAGESVAVLDTDPQGSLGRWFMARHAGGAAGAMGFATASAWGTAWEVEKLRGAHDWVFVDTPPKVDADLRPALRAADLVLVPVASSHLDLWATESVLDLAGRERAAVLIVLNRANARARLTAEVAEAVAGLSAPMARATFGNRVAYAAALGEGRGAVETARGGPAAGEVRALLDEIRAAMD